MEETRFVGAKSPAQRNPLADPAGRFVVVVVQRRGRFAVDNMAAYMYNPDGTVPINIIGSTGWDLSKLPTIRDTVEY